MSQDSKEYKKLIFKNIDKISKKTEVAYTSLAASFPNLLKEMNDGFVQSKNMIDLFFDSNHHKQDNLNIDTILSNITKDINKASVFFEGTNKESDGYFQDLSKGIKNLENLEDNIQIMKNSSIDMEIISINTLTVAVRAGKAGGAFSYITNEIKKITQNMTNYAEELSSKSDAIRNGLRKHQKDFHEISEFQKDIFTHLGSDLQNSFDQFSNSVEVVLGSFKNLSIKAQEIEKPVLSLMETMQFQDIIRQSLEQITMSLNAEGMRHAKHSHNIEDQLDYYKLLDVLSLTSISVIDDVSEKMIKNIATFEEKINEVKVEIEAIENERRLLVSESSLSNVLNGTVTSMDKLVNDIGESNKLKKEFLENGISQTKSIQTLRSLFNIISSIVGRFQNIAIASKIEVAKQEALRDMEGNIKEMTDLISQIENTLDGGNGLVDSFISSIEKIMNDYTRIVALEQRYFNDFEVSLKDKYNIILDFQKVVEKKILGFKVFSNSFLDIFVQLSVNFDELKNSLNLLNETKILINNYHREIVREFNDILMHSEYKTWDIKSEKAKEIINKFTIFVHKEAASKATGVEMDSGNVMDEGEILLF